MAQFGFHVTHQSNVDSIKETGISATTSGSSWRKQRKQFHNKIDTLLESEYSRYTSRQEAVFFWATIPDADEYIRTAFEDPSEYVIVTVDLSSYNTWAIDNQLIEQLFEKWMNSDKSAFTQQEQTELVQSARKWAGEQTSRIEVWCAAPTDATDISDIQ